MHLKKSVNLNQLIQSIKNRNFDQFNRYINYNTRLIRELTPNGLSAIHIAARINDIRFFQAIIKLVPDSVNITDKFGRTASHYAAAHGKRKIINTLGQTDIKLLSHKDNNGKTPMHYAIENNQTQIAQDIHGYSDREIRQQDNEGNNVAHLAAQKNSTEETLKLISNLHPTAFSLTNQKSLTPGNVAVINNQQNNVSYLLKHHPVAFDIPFTNGSRAIHFAGQHGRNEIITQLHQINPKALHLKNKHGYTAATYAAISGKTSTIAHIHKLSSATLNHKTVSGRVIAHFAAMYDHTETLKEIIKIDSLLITVPDNGINLTTPLEIAIKRRNLEIIELTFKNHKELLVDGGEFDNIPIHLIAAHCDFNQLSAELRKHIISTPQINYLGETPLAIILKRTDVKCMKWLKQERAIIPARLILSTLNKALRDKNLILFGNLIEMNLETIHPTEPLTNSIVMKRKHLVHGLSAWRDARFLKEILKRSPKLALLKSLEGSSPALYAAKGGSLACLKALHSADPKALLIKSNDGLNAAQVTRNAACLKYIISVHPTLSDSKVNKTKSQSASQKKKQKTKSSVNNVFFTNQKKVQSSSKKKKRKTASSKGKDSRKKSKTIAESKQQPKHSP